MEVDLQALLEVVGDAAKADGTCVGIFIDEIQYVKEDELAALITALHRTSQRQLPVIMLGAGLPQVRGRMGKAKSYAERLPLSSLKSAHYLLRTQGWPFPSQRRPRK